MDFYDAPAARRIFQGQFVIVVIELLQAGLLLATEGPSRQETLIGRLSLIPLAAHFVADRLFLAEVASKA